MAQESRKQKEKQFVGVDCGDTVCLEQGVATGTDGWHLSMRTSCGHGGRHPLVEQ